jgi:hypothetical protein
MKFLVTVTPIVPLTDLDTSLAMGRGQLPA